MEFSAQRFEFTKVAFSVNETTKLVSISRTVLYANVKAGKLRMTKIGKKSVFLAPDIAEFLSNLPKSTTA